MPPVIRIYRSLGSLRSSCQRSLSFKFNVSSPASACTLLTKPTADSSPSLNRHKGRSFHTSCIRRYLRVPSIEATGSKRGVIFTPGTSLSPANSTEIDPVSPENMDLGVESYEHYRPKLVEALRNADFVAFDLEFSGIRRPAPGKNRKQTLQEKYYDMKRGAELYQVLQLGLCPVVWDEKKGGYLARPINIHVNPVVSNPQLRVNRRITLQADAFQFLHENGLDFNALISDGVPYLSRAEETRILADREIQTESYIETTSENMMFIEQVKQGLQTWLDDPDSPYDYLDLSYAGNNLNSYQRRLIYQIVRVHFPGLITSGKGNYVRVFRVTESQRAAIEAERVERRKEELDSAIGLRHLIDELFDPKRPDGKKIVLVGHNLFADLVYLYACFIGPLPETATAFMAVIHKSFPMVIDTKYLATYSDTTGDINSSLSAIWELLKEQNNPQIEPHHEHRYYEESLKYHQAGYDAYITAQILIKLAARIYSHMTTENPTENNKTAIPDTKKFLETITTSDLFEDDVSFIPKFHESGSQEFWTRFVNKLRVFGTVEGFVRLSPYD